MAGRFHPSTSKLAIKRQGPKVRLPGIDAAELRAVLAAETRPRIRKRLLALQALDSGAARREAAQIAGVGFGSIRNWIRTVQRSGWKTLTRTPVRRKPFASAAKARALKETEAALARRLDARSRRRITVVRDVLSGQDIYTVSRRENISPTTIIQWLARARRFGVTNLIHRPNKQTVKAKPHGRRQIVASPGRRIGLTPTQLWELSELLQQRPAMSWAYLLLAVEQRFGVTYSKRGIARLVQQELGYRRVGRRLLRGPSQGRRKSRLRKR